MKNCCEKVEMGYMDCQKCYEIKDSNIKNDDLYKRFLRGDKLTLKEIMDLRKKLNL